MSHIHSQSTPCCRGRREDTRIHTGNQEPGPPFRAEGKADKYCTVNCRGSPPAGARWPHPATQARGPWGWEGRPEKRGQSHPGSAHGLLSQPQAVPSIPTGLWAPAGRQEGRGGPSEAVRKVAAARRAEAEEKSLRRKRNLSFALKVGWGGLQERALSGTGMRRPWSREKQPWRSRVQGEAKSAAATRL